MIEAAARWTARGISLLVLGPLAAWGGGLVRAPDGTEAASLLTGGAIGEGVLALVLVLGAVCVAAVIGGRLGDRHESLLNMGFVLAWVAWTGGRMEEVFRLSPGSGPLVWLAIEAALMALMVIGVMVLSDRLGRRSREAEGLDLSVEGMLGALRFKAGVPVLLLAAGIGLVSAWLFARYGGAGQGVGSAFLGGVIGGVFASQAYESLAKDQKKAPLGSTGILVPALLGVLLAAVLAPLVGMVKPGAGRLPEGVARGTLPGWVLVSPAAWMAGGLLGIPAGVSMLRSAGKQQAPVAAVKPAAG